jgi:hypothetical protein
MSGGFRRYIASRLFGGLQRSRERDSAVKPLAGVVWVPVGFSTLKCHVVDTSAYLKYMHGYIHAYSE